MEVVQEIVIVGAGIAGLATALGLHRIGLKSLVLESSESLRVTGFAFTTWTNAWRALDALGIGDSLRERHTQIQGMVATSTLSGANTAKMSFRATGKHGEHEVRCVRRNLLVESMAKLLPEGTIKFGSKLVSIEENDKLIVVHLADGSTIKTKVLIGCDGVNSVVAKWVGLKKPSFAGRSAARGFVDIPDGHGFKPEFQQYFGGGFRSGFLPCDHKTMCWFFNWSPCAQDKELEESPAKMKEYIMSKIGRVPKQIFDVLEKTKLDNIISSPLRFRSPFSLLWTDICKGNVCVAGDALHPMTPDLGQGGCAALEDGVVLARCLGEALQGGDEGEENAKIKMCLEKYSKQRRMRGFDLIATSFVLGRIQQSDGKLMNFLRDKFLSQIMINVRLKKADFDCGKLSIS